MILANSPVLFNKELHTYTIEGKFLRGITGLLHEKLFPNTYTGVDPEKLRSSAAYGSAVHQMCEEYDTMGTLYGNDDVLAYINLVEYNNLLHQASEYLVSDDDQYASSIDKVYIVDEHTVDIADIKTTSTLNKEYVSWQLSVYAYFFELMNPDIHVRNLYGIHLRNGNGKLVQVPRKPIEAVEALLYLDAYDGCIMPDKYKQREDEIIRMAHLAKYYADKVNELKAELLEDMGQETKWESNRVVITRKEGGKRAVFDAKALQANEPTIYERYVKESEIKPSITIKIKEQ